MAAATDAMLQAWDHLQAYAFPPVAMIHAVLNKIRSSVGAEITLIAPFWPMREWFPDLLSLKTKPPDNPSDAVGSAPSDLCQKVPSKVIRSSSSCVVTLHRQRKSRRILCLSSSDSLAAPDRSSLANLSVKVVYFPSLVLGQGPL